MDRRLLSIVFALLIILPILASIGAPVAVAQATKGPRSDKIIFTRVPLEQVPSAFQAGDIDVYIFGLRPAQAEQLKANPDVKLWLAPAGLIDLGLNPAPVYTKNYTGVYSKEEIANMEGVPVEAITYFEVSETAGWTYAEFGAHPDYGINPLAFREIRFAINYLVDREYIATEIIKGYGVPMYTFLSQYDPDYAVIADIVAEYKFVYAPALADQIITSVLTKVGAEKIAGKWYYQGKPITLKFIIRVEDERRDIGDLVANELDRLGLSVERLYLSFWDAILKVYFTDPIDFEWHIYTEGWGKGGIDKYDSGTINQFGCPWFGWLPGWGEPTYWNYKNKTLDELGQRIYLGKFKSKEERDELYREATKLIIEESVRIWIATRLDVHVTNVKVKGVTLDLGAGLRGIWNLREMYREDNPAELKVGHLWVWTPRSVWNIYGGFTDVYSVDIERGTYDPFIWVHPFSGMPIAFRTPFVVNTAGPEGELDVPSDAVVWDAKNDQWVHVGDGVKAKSVVEFDLSKLIGTKWHHGITITWADVLATWAFWWEITYDPEKSSIEGAIAAPNQPWFDTIKGLKFDFENNKLYVYVDYWHFAPEYIASYASLTVNQPIEMHEVMFYLAFTEKSYALSSTRSRAEGIPQLSLIVPEHVADVKRVLETFVDNTTIFDEVVKYVTVDGKAYLTLDEWNARVNAVLNWINKYNLAWISQGPLMLTYFNIDQQRAELTAFRDESYPFKPGDWYFGEPRPTKILQVGTPVISPGDPATIVIEVTGIPPLFVKYVIRDLVTGKVIKVGNAEQTAPTSFTITLDADFTSQLREFSSYELTVIAFSDAVAMPDARTVIIQTGGSFRKLGEQIQQQTEEAISSLQKQLQDQISSIQSQLQDQIESIQEALGATVAESFQSVSESIQTLGDTISKGFEDLGTSIGNLASALQALGQSVDEIKSKVSSLEQRPVLSRSDVEEVVSSKVGELSGTLGTLQTLEIVILILVLIAIAIPFVKK